jgi:hypothetical protein
MLGLVVYINRYIRGRAERRVKRRRIWEMTVKAEEQRLEAERGETVTVGSRWKWRRYRYVVHSRDGDACTIADQFGREQEIGVGRLLLACSPVSEEGADGDDGRR